MRNTTLLVLILAGAVTALGARPQRPSDFHGGVDLINVTAWVTDRDGRFVAGLREQDFTVFEDGKQQEISYFSSDRVPVSLGLVLDASGSMTAEKMASARSAIDRFVGELLAANDEFFFLEFASRPHLVQEWTTDRRAIRSAAARVRPGGGTAIYDAIADALPLASVGKHPKKAVLVISDGNDTNSRVTVRELQQRIRETEVLVYALGVDGTMETAPGPPRVRPPLPRPPFPIPGRRPPRTLPQITFGRGARMGGGRVDAEALRRITDDTGGRTQIIRSFGDLSDATARIADELSKQYYLGYISTGKKDGLWHEIRVEAAGRGLNVRARKGYVAS